VDTVRRTLRLPYAAIQLANEPAPACSSGEPPAGTATFPLAHAGNEVGVLVVGLRRGETDLAGADLQLLSAFAQQIGVAALGVRVTRDLRRSRERLVLAREEERRRLRRDLHDGVGPALAGIALGLETAGRAAEREASSISELLVALHRETTACLDCVRQVAADLRPPALDQIGLVAALRQQADLLGNRSGSLVVRVQQASALPDLTAAVESAASRIAVEAMTNAVRHADGHCCWVSIGVDGDRLRVVVTDDGTGTPDGPPGIGLASMRERAEELGGSCMVAFVAGHGTRVAAEVPVVAR
jgi:signal transduction histidine kinase